MQTANKYFELVKNEGRKNELVLLTSENRYLLSFLKEECKKYTRSRDRYAVRPQLVHLVHGKEYRKGRRIDKENS